MSSHPNCPGVGRGHQHYQGKCATDWSWGTGKRSREARSVWPAKQIYAVVEPDFVAGKWKSRVFSQFGGPPLYYHIHDSSNAAKAAATRFVEKMPRANPAKRRASRAHSGDFRMGI